VIGRSDSYLVTSLVLGGECTALLTLFEVTSIQHFLCLVTMGVMKDEWRYKAMMRMSWNV